MAIYDAAIKGLGSAGVKGRETYVGILAESVSQVSSERDQKNRLGLVVRDKVNLVDSPVPGCEMSDDCRNRTPENTVTPVIRRIYGIPDPVPDYSDWPPVIDWSEFSNFRIN